MADIVLTGYAVRFDELSVDLGGFRERFQQGAFAETLADGDTKFMLRSHDLARPVASTSSDTLELSEDSVGLRFTARLPDSGDAGDLASMVRRKVLSRMSFAFATERASDESFSQVNGEFIRTIRRAKLLEVSPVTLPAYPTTTVSARSDNPKERMQERQAAIETKAKTRRERDRRRKQLRLADAHAEANKPLPEPPPERPEVRRARIQQKRSRLAKTK